MFYRYLGLNAEGRNFTRALGMLGVLAAPSMCPAEDAGVTPQNFALHGQATF